MNSALEPSIVMGTLVIFPDIWQPRMAGHLEKTLRWGDPGRAMLPVCFCNVDYLRSDSPWCLMLYTINGCSGATVEKHKGTRPILEYGTTGIKFFYIISFTVRISYNATQPGSLQDSNQFPWGLHKHGGAVKIRAEVSLLAQYIKVHHRDVFDCHENHHWEHLVAQG